MCYNFGMNEEQTMFAEMLGIRRAKPTEDVKPAAATLPESPVESNAEEENFDELDVQKEVVKEIAREKAELEGEKAKAESEKALLEAERAKLADEKRSLEERVRECEREVAELKAHLDETLAVNAQLEVKLTRMGKALFAARRATVEASKVVIGGRRW